MTTSRLTHQQVVCLGILSDCAPSGLDCPTLGKLLETSPQGAAATASSLVDRGWLVRFVGGVGKQRVHFALADVRACAVFAACENPATTVVPHPVLGDVPSCERCKDKMEVLAGDNGTAQATG